MRKRLNVLPVRNRYETTVKSARQARSAVVKGKQDYLWVLSAGINYDNG
jgi:hypothetical protein